MSISSGGGGATGKGGYIEDLVPGRRFYDYLFALRGEPKILVTDGKKRAVLNLGDCTGVRTAIRWDLTDDEEALLFETDVVRVTGTISGPDDRYPDQITLQKLEAAALSPEDFEHFCAPLPADHDETLLRFQRLRGTIGQTHLAALLDRVFDDDRFWPGFERAVAAGNHHHAFPGGLLLHTVEVAELARASCRVLPFLRHDLLVTAALLHDIGKVYEMDHGLRAGEYTSRGNLLGHIHEGAFKAQAAMGHVPAFPGGLKQALLHLILSHHESPEWGSPKTPGLPEAVVLAQCDQMSAHATEWHEAKRKAKRGQKSVLKADGRRICVEDLGLSDLDLGGLPEPLSHDADGLDLMELPMPKYGEFVLALPEGVGELTLRGMVAAGDGETVEGYQDTGEKRTVTLPPGGADYLVRVEGESMIEAGILPGDLAYVREQKAPPPPGEIVVAYVPESGPVIKRLGTAPDGSPALLSENPDRLAYPPIPITEGTRIQGVVTRVERDLRAAYGGGRR